MDTSERRLMHCRIRQTRRHACHSTSCSLDSQNGLHLPLASITLRAHDGDAAASLPLQHRHRQQQQDGPTVRC